MENDIEGLKAFELLKKNIEIENKNNLNEIIDEGINLNNIQSLSQIKNMPPTNNLLINARKYVIKCRIINMKKKLFLEEEKQIEKQIKEEEEEQKEKQQLQNKIKLILNDENNNNNNNNNNIFKTDININNNNNKIKINKKKKSLITINPKQQAYDDFVNGCLDRLEEEKKFNQKYNKENNEMIRKYMNDNRNCIIKKIMKYKNNVPYENILNEIVCDLHNLCDQFVPKNFINDKKNKKNRNKIFLPPIHKQKQNLTINLDVYSKYSNDNNNNSKNNLFNNENINNCINNNKNVKINKTNINYNNNINENDFKLNSDIIPKKSKKILFISLNKKNIKNKNINNNNNNNSINDTTNSKSVNTIPVEIINNNL